MLFFKPRVAILFMLLMTASLCAHKCKEPPQGPDGPAGANGINPHEVYAWVQSNYSEFKFFNLGDDITFNAPPQMLNGIEYLDPGFQFQTSGYYQVTFEGYLVYIDLGTSSGLQFYLNGTPIGGSYAPIPSDFYYLNPYLFTIQAIFYADPGDVLNIRVIGNSDGAINFYSEAGSATADIKIVKLSN